MNDGPAPLSIVPPTNSPLAPVIDQPADQNPAAVYLAHLGPGGRRAMRQALEVMAGLLLGVGASAFTCPWGALRFQHTTAARARLAEQYRPAIANKMLSALRGVLKMAWRLGQMSAEEYQRAADLPAVKGETLPVGREVQRGELAALLDGCAADAPPAAAAPPARSSGR